MKLVISGSVSFDVIMTMPKRFTDYLLPDKLHILNVSFLMDTFRQEMGGCAGNQAYGLALLGYRPVLLASAGRKDFSSYKKHLIKAGVDCSLLRLSPKLKTAIGFCLTDKDNNQLWGFYSGAMAEAKNLSLPKNDFLVIAPNDPTAMVNYLKLSAKKNYRFLFDPAFQISRLPKAVLQLGVNRAEIVIGNDYEIALLKKKVKLNPQKILITTFGAKGSVIKAEGKIYQIPIAKPTKSLDPTGAGDAYRAGFLAGYLKKLPLSVCGRMGALSAVYTVEKCGTQTHQFSLKAFKQRYQLNFKEKLNYEI